MENFSPAKAQVQVNSIIELSKLSIQACEALILSSVDLNSLTDPDLGEFFEDAGNFFISISEKISENRIKAQQELPGTATDSVVVNPNPRVS